MTYVLPMESYHNRQPSISSTKSGTSAYSTDTFSSSRASTVTSNSSSSTRFAAMDLEKSFGKMNIVPEYADSARTQRDRLGRSSPRSSPSPSPTKSRAPMPSMIRAKTMAFEGTTEDKIQKLTRKLDFDEVTLPQPPSHHDQRPTLQKYESDPTALSRSDTIRPLRPVSMILSPTGTGSPLSVTQNDFGTMKNSSVGHLRTLSTDVGGSELAAIPGARNVAGMHGRKRLTRVQTAGAKSSWTSQNWMDQQRKYLQAYEYLCHIGEAKEWIEKCIEEEIPPIVQLEEALRNGITLARLVKVFAPDLVPKIFMDTRLQFRHSDNIVRFFKFVDRVGLPEIFVFELTDLYDKKNIPKVIYCIHALSFMLFRLGMTDNIIGNLVGKLEFTEDELQTTQRGLDMSGVSLPSFRGMEKHFEPEPEPEPVETEEERIQRELLEAEESIADLQAFAKGALARVRLGWLMDDLWQHEQHIMLLQAMIRGMFSRTVFAYKADISDFATELQSLIRGVLARKNMKNKMRTLKQNEPSVLLLQSLYRGCQARKSLAKGNTGLIASTTSVTHLQATIRGAVSRKNLQTRMDAMYRAEPQITTLQSKIRGGLARRRIASQQSNISISKNSVEALQARLRGNMTRQRIDQKLQLLQTELPAITTLQATCRGILLRSKGSKDKLALETSLECVVAIQAAIRGSRTRKHMKRILDQLQSFSPKVTIINSVVRGLLARQIFDKMMKQLQHSETKTLDLQSRARGLLDRKDFVSKCERLHNVQPQITTLQALARGALFRGRENVFLAELHTEHTEEISGLQACIRGALARRDARYTVECLADEEPEVVEFQSLLRGAIARKAFHGKLKHYDDNMERVIKIQSFVRARQQGEAYRSLTTGKNPPVGTIKNFVHLLNDSDFDFNEEIEFERKRKTLVQHVRANEIAEHYIEELDIKIGLLIRNKITLDEVVKYQKLGGHGGMTLSNMDISSKDPFDLKALNKSSRRKLELYQMLFFALQTQPEYLSRLFKRVRAIGTGEKDLKKLENLVIGLFGYATKRREEYYLLKLIGQSIKEELVTCKSPQDFLRGNFVWTKLMVNYIRSPRDKKYMRDFLGTVIKEKVLENDQLDLENNPLQIYRSIINNEELSTGRKSNRPQDITREEAIRDPETRQLFVQHLEDLRDLAETFLDALEDNVLRLPFGVRHLAFVSYNALLEAFPNESQDHIFQVVEHFIYQKYFNPVVIGPEAFGITDRATTPMQKKNLAEVSKVLNQVSAGQFFTSGDDVYLQPLNEWMEEANTRMFSIFKKLIMVPSLEKQFDMDEFDDLTARQHPTLYIKLADVFALHANIARELDFIAPEKDDQIRDLIRELGNVKNADDELQRASGAEINLTLNPRLSKVEDPEGEVKALFVETKRCILYIIRVQQGGNLMEILVKPITSEDEHKWAVIVQEEASGKKRGAYADASSHALSDISLLTYSELKKTALENVLKLEQTGKISRHNHFQEILNAIANDIRTKHRRREQRHRELDGVKQTLNHLDEKAKFLDEKLKSYNDYIEQAMSTLQSTKKKGKRGFIFSRQYFHIRELEKSGKVPKFGSYKYSARNLIEKEVLVSIEGYNDRQYDKISFTLSSDEVGVFYIEASYGSMMIPGASAHVPLDDLLQAQFNNHQFMSLFEGMIKLNVNLFLHLLFKKFYRDG